MRPGPAFWTWVYLIVDFGGIWPYVSANAAVPLAAAFWDICQERCRRPTFRWNKSGPKSGLSRSVVRELSEHPERFGLSLDVALKTGLPLELMAKDGAESR